MPYLTYKDLLVRLRGLRFPYLHSLSSSFACFSVFLQCINNYLYIRKKILIQNREIGKIYLGTIYIICKYVFKSEYKFYKITYKIK
jgi:hypothetical protein